MCGICGVVGAERPRAVERMSTSQTHRGPNDVGVHQDERVTLANQRLSVIDVEGGDQPIYNEDGDVAVVFNGEIFNFPSLRADLRARGHTFSTDTDTEVFVHGYEEYGTDFFEQLNGMFGVAIYDQTRDRLLLARDRAGIKPLYITDLGDSLAFASEPKAFLQSGLVEPAVDRDALRYFLQLRYSPSKDSLFEGISPVPPGTYVDVQLTNAGYKSTEHQFWTLADVPSSPPTNPTQAVRNTLRRAVGRQLMSDVPIGFYLSGGLDTSSVVALADEISDEPIHTFCMAFADSKWDESADARAVAEHFGTNHHEITIGGDFMSDFPEMIWYAGEPKRNLYPYYVAQKMSENVTVALGGLGADELFGGYVYRYNQLKELETIRASHGGGTAAVTERAAKVRAAQLAEGPLENDHVLEEVGTLEHLDDPAQLYLLLNSSDVLGDDEFYDARVFAEELVGQESPTETIRERLSDVRVDGDTDLRERALQWDFTVKLPNDFLFVEDRMSMAHSLESRVPFLDNELIDLAFSLPLSEKFGGSSKAQVGKQVLRNAMREYLPESVFEKDKQGFTMPTFEFAKVELLDEARLILNDAHVVNDGFVDESYVDNLLDRRPHRALTPHYKMLWKVVALEIWYQTFIVNGAKGPLALESYYT